MQSSILYYPVQLPNPINLITKLAACLFGVSPIRNKKMHKDVLKSMAEGFAQPTNEDIYEFRNWTGFTSLEIATILDIDPKHFREYMNEKAYIRGKKIPYVIWRFLIESFGLVKPVLMQPRKPLFRPEVFSKENWIQPTVREFGDIIRRAGFTKNGAAKILDMPPNFVEGALRSDSTADFPIAKEKWFSLLERSGLTSMESMLKPKLPPNTLVPLTGENYMPPMPIQLRAFIGWTGRSVDEIAALVGMKDSQLRFYCSNKSYNDNRESSKQLPVQLFSRDGWVPPFSRELKMFSKSANITLRQLKDKLGLDEKFLKTAFASATSKRIFIDQQRWFALLDEIGVLSADDFHKKYGVEQEEEKPDFTPIPAVTWRLLLQMFGVIEPIHFERKKEA